MEVLFNCQIWFEYRKWVKVATSSHRLRVVPTNKQFHQKWKESWFWICLFNHTLFCGSLLAGDFLIALQVGHINQITQLVWAPRETKSAINHNRGKLCIRHVYFESISVLFPRLLACPFLLCKAHSNRVAIRARSSQVAFVELPSER